MLGYKIDFNSCGIVPGFGKSSHIYYTIPVTMASAEHSFSALKLIKEFNDSREIKPLYALTCAQRDRPNGS